eukprot:gnl/MRDRNA2_/MRDRNA2_83543_c0_seq2.p1 gnl/MRDRNA2_/MRDRNA2_83543_c0~~gnl/MRDRNA2_/MRDRNA2_83543_c0_seq2.p1  ORF type:complete len:137 (+),score=14.22 gnl/MRDRNA2_/MRDRNA2_83543_c0_seq2:187-597(+)
MCENLAEPMRFIAQEAAITAQTHSLLAIEQARAIIAVLIWCLKVAQNFNTQNLANPAWALSKWGCGHSELMDAISAPSINKISEGTAQHIANTLWSFARRLVKDSPLMEALASPAIRKITEFKEQGLANIAWSLAV